MPFTLKNLTGLIQAAVKHEASDIHIRTDESPCFRIHGELVPVQTKPFTEPEIADICRILFANDELVKRLSVINELDGGYSVPDVCRIRFNFFRYFGNKIGLILRIVKIHVPSIQELGLPNIIKKVADQERGLILVTGATGSGKSTTLAAMINRINNKKNAHIITIEDPIEYIHTPIKSRITQREIGHDTKDYSIAMRAALRQDPDVILIGEMRDPETITTALKAAETGHVVFSTMHTTNAITTIGRMISMFPAEEQRDVRERLSANLTATVCQRMLDRIDGGSVVAMEILLVSVGARECIAGKEDITRLDEIIRLGKGKGGNGSQSFDQHILDLFEAGVVSQAEAKSASSSESDFIQQLLIEK
jgi:twitching motility protein PilT